MDNVVLKEKRKNLFNLGINATELYTNNAFLKITHFFSEADLLQFVENAAVSELRISKTTVLEKIKSFIEPANSNIQIMNILQMLDCSIKSSYQHADLTKIKNDIIATIVDQRMEELNSLLDVSLQAKIAYYDTSVWRLHLGYGLLEGVISFPNKDDLVLRAPLINIEIEIIKDASGEIVIKKNNNDVIANELLELYVDEQLEKSTRLASEIEKDLFLANGYFAHIANVIPNVEIDNDYSLITNLSKENLLKQSPYLKIKKSFFIISFNPTGGKMLKDYDAIIEQNYQFPTYDTIFHQNLDHLIFDADQIYQINSPLNLIQKLAIVNSMNKNILIYGPPGTGKSEVVANAIANALINNKNIVAISEKKAALDVLDQRLLALNTLSMSAFDEKNSDVFYKRIINMNHLIVSVNDLELQINNQSYQTLIQYQKLWTQLQNYMDLCGHNITDFMQTYDQINMIQYQRNSSIISFLYEQLKNNGTLTLKAIIDNAQLLKELQNYFFGVFGAGAINPKIYDEKRIRELLNNYENILEKDRPFALRKFITENVIVDKKPIFHGKKQDDDININRIIELLHIIIDKKVYYLENYAKINTFKSEIIDVEKYVALYDWIKNTKINDFLKLISENKTCQFLIKKYWNDQLNNIKNNDVIIRDYYVNSLKKRLLANRELEVKWTELVRKANLTKRPSVNRVIREYYTTLKQVFPVWILSPEATSAIVPLNLGEFDYGIFDEASQMRLERGIPLIYRCKFTIVSGDDKQLKPTSFFKKTNTLDDTYIGDLDNVDSLLDKAKASNWMSFTLTNHYRAISEQLIYFSNHYFYNDQLLCISKNGEFTKAVDVYDVNGVYDRENGINIEEADKVVTILNELIPRFKTAIVVTFNAKQADLIRNKCLSSPLSPMIENLNIKVRSLENVQGDEANIVIISTTFGKDKNNKFIQNFGPVNQDGGKNRINVMASRAKERMVVVKSFSAADIDNIHNENTLIFKNFIAYVEQIQLNNDITKPDIINQTANVNHAIDIAQEIVNELLAHDNYIIQQNHKIGSHVVNIAVTKKDAPRIAICILIDTSQDWQMYSNNFKNWISSIDKQRYFEDRGYNTFRINVAEWKINRHQIIKSLKAQIV